MLRSEAIAIIKRGLGFRQTQDAAIIAALQQAQRELELGKTLPDWLVHGAIVTVTPGSGGFDLPERFIRVHDDLGVYYQIGSYYPVFLTRKWYSEAYADAYGGNENADEVFVAPANRYPTAYTITSKSRGGLYPFPTATDLTSIVMNYYRGAEVLDGEMENLWLEYAPDYLIGVAGGIVAGQLRDVGAAQVFTSQAQRGQRAFLGDVVETELSSRPLIMGEEQLMGLEALTPTTYISGLTQSWPIASELKSQGDDHLRLIKGVLQNTFPNATRPFVFPSVTALNGPSSLGLTAATHDKGTIVVATTGGVATITLPALVIGDAGWSVSVVKYTSDATTVLIQPASGTIVTQFGSVATMRLGSVCAAVRLLWTGAIWIATRDGPMIGSTVNWDGAAVPAGWLALDGSAFVAATYTELYLALGSVATLRDKRGRAEIGSGTGSGLTARSAGTTYGAETKTLATANLPAYTPTGTINVGTISGGGAIKSDATFSATIGAGVAVPNGTAASITPSGSWTFSGTAQGGLSTAFDLLQPSIGVQKIIRAS